MSSFRKRTPASQAKPPPATKLNAHSAQLLVSTGVPSLDDVLGGGLPVGGIFLIEEDRQTGYSNTLLSYFSSQAIAAGHRLCVVNASQEVDLAKQLPGWSNVTRNKQPLATAKMGDEDEDMKIAWRYKNLPKVVGGDNEDENVDENSATAASVPYCERFDLSTQIPQDVVDRSQIEVLDIDAIADLMASANDKGQDMYQCVLDKITALISDGYSSLKPVPPSTERNILRIVIRSLGSAFWQGSSSTSILGFLHRLRGLLRYSYATCIISFPIHLYRDNENTTRLPIVRRVEHLCDAVIELESFEGTYASPADIIARQIHGQAITPASQDYHGFLHIRKLPRLNSLTASMGRLSLLHTGGGSENNLAFRLRRKKFSIETYHLPIEGGVTERRVPTSEHRKSEDASKTNVGGGMGCGSAPGRKDPLEF